MSRLSSIGWALITVGLAVAPSPVRAGGSVPVGTYLYAKPEDPKQFTGQLTVRFANEGNRMVVAYGRKYRKDRQSRENTTEAERQIFKPWLGQVIENGKTAIFWNLPVDRYDLVVIDDQAMSLHEGLELQRGADPEIDSATFLDEVTANLSPREDRIGGWEGFFDTKRFERMETDGSRGCVLVQQMRLGKAYAESGDVLKGCIHSIDMCWLQRSPVEGVGWQVVTRQQLYRDELPARTFFTHAFVPELMGIRVARGAREIGPITLP